MKKSFILKGNICQTKDPVSLDLHERAFAVCVEGVSCGVFDVLPEEYASLPLYDCGDALIFPGMIDLPRDHRCDPGVQDVFPDGGRRLQAPGIFGSVPSCHQGRRRLFRKCWQL